MERTANISADVQARLRRLDTVYANPTIYLIMVLCMNGFTLALGLAAHSNAILIVAAAMSAIGLARYCVSEAWRSARRRRGDAVDPAGWENSYLATAAILSFLCGATAIAAFPTTTSDVVRLSSVIGAVVWMVGSVMYNFALMRVAIIQIVALSAPLAVGLSMGGGFYAALAVIGVPPLAFGCMVLARRLAAIMDESLRAAQENARLAEQLDLALNAMPHGLLTFDDAGRLRVASHAAAGLLGLERARLRGERDEILRAIREAGAFTPEQCDLLALAWAQAAQDEPGEPLTMDFEDGARLTFRTRRMKAGGAILLIEDATERRRAEERIRDAARRDPLTGLPARSHFNERLDAEIRAADGDALALMIVDIDYFKEVNDTFGHAAGDALLRELAARICEASPEQFVARLGGDEFVVLVAAPDAALAARRIGARIQAALKAPVMIGERKARSGASIGFAVARAGDDCALLFERADQALYAAKRAGRGRCRDFDELGDAAPRQDRPDDRPAEVA